MLDLDVVLVAGRPRIALIRDGARCYLGCAPDAAAPEVEAAISAHPIAALWWRAATSDQRAATLARRS